MRKHLPWLLIPIALAGIWLSLDLVDTHFRLVHQPTMQFDSWCEVNETFSCAEVNRSKYSSISLGEGRAELPVAVPAMGFFAMLAFLGFSAASANDGEKRRQALALAAVLTVPGLIFSAYLVGVQAFALGAWCLLCLLMDACVLASLLIAFFAHGGGVAGIKDDLSPLPSALVFGAVLLLVVPSYATWSSYDARVTALGDDAGKPSTGGDGGEQSDQEQLEQTRQAIQDFYPVYKQLTPFDLRVLPQDGIKGNVDAEIVVIEFADFECPHCRLAGFFLKDIAHRYGDRAKFVFKNYPIDKACNTRLTREAHTMACETAQSAICAGQQGQFWDMHDLSFDAQEDLSTKVLQEIARGLPLDYERWRQCTESDATTDLVKEQIQQGWDIGLEGTPTFLVNGKLLPMAHPLFVEAAIRQELIARGEMSLPEDEEQVFGDL